MKHNAIIRWFDALSGEGMVRLNNGRSVYIHFTAIESINKHNHQWPTDADKTRLSKIQGQQCLVELIEDTTFVQVSKCRLVSGL